MVSAVWGWVYLASEVLKEVVVLNRLSSVCTSRILLVLVANRATLTQISLLAAPLLCAAISLDRRQAVTGLLAYQQVDKGRRVGLMNVAAYGVAALAVVPFYSDSVVPAPKDSSGLGGPKEDGVGVCCQTLFFHRTRPELHVAWLDDTQIRFYPGAVGCPWELASGRDVEPWRTLGFPPRLVMSLAQSAVYAFLVASNVLFLRAYRKDRQRAAKHAAKSKAKQPVSARRIATILLLSSALHLAIGSLTVFVNVVPDFPAGLHLVWVATGGRVVPLLSAATTALEALGAFSLVSTATFYLAISKAFRHHFLSVLRLRKDASSSQAHVFALK